MEIFPHEGLDYILARIPRGATTPTSLFCGLFTSQTATTVPTATALLAAQSGVTEAAGPGYSRVEVPAATWSAPEPTPGGRLVRATQFAFSPVGSGGWGVVNGFFLASASFGGVALYYSNFDSAEGIPTAATDVIKVTPRWTLLA